MLLLFSKIFTTSLLTIIWLNSFFMLFQYSPTPHFSNSQQCLAYNPRDSLTLILLTCCCCFYSHFLPCTRTMETIPANGIQNKSVILFLHQEINVCIYFHSLFLLRLLETHDFFIVIKISSKSNKQTTNDNQYNTYW